MLSIPINRVNVLILLSVLKVSLCARSVKVTHCKTTVQHSTNYSEEKHDLLIPTFLTGDDPHQWLRKWGETVIQSLARNLMKYIPSDPDFNVNYIHYDYASVFCNVSTTDLFLDVLLNRTLFNGKPYKILAIFTLVNRSELLNLINLVSPYSIPIIAVEPVEEQKQFDLDQYSSFESYNNVYLALFSFSKKIETLTKFIKKVNAKIVTIFHDSEDEKMIDDINAISTNLKKNLVCVTFYLVKATTSQKTMKSMIQKERSNVFLFILRDYKVLLKLSNVFNSFSDKKRMILIDNYDWVTNVKWIRAVNESYLFTSFKNNLLDIYIIRGSYKVSYFLYYAYIKTIFLSVEMLFDIFVKSKQKLITEVYRDVESRTFNQASHKFLKNLTDLLFNHLEERGKFQVLNDIDIYFLTIPDTDEKEKLVYTFKRTSKKLSGWKCGLCKNLTSYKQVCTTGICPAGHYPVYLAQGCCWQCQRCFPGFVKPNEGQQLCTKCNFDTIANANQTQCLPFVFQYFELSDLQQVIVVVLCSVGSLYTSVFLGVFMYFKDTPVVRSSNLKLSVFQMVLHLLMNTQVALTLFKQIQYLCILHSIMGGYLLRLIMAIYIIKTNQLLTIFQSKTKIERNVCLKFKEMMFPAIYMTANIFISTLFLAVYSKFEYGVSEVKSTTLKYNFCNMETYFHVDVALVILLSIICSVQAFIARKLPTNFNETYYIFLGMFTTTILLLLSLPLNASFSGDGQKIFVNSVMIYSANLALISIAYGYKIHIMLFQKHLNTKEAFQRIMLQSIQETVNKQTRSLDQKG